MLRFADVAVLQQAAADLEKNGTDDGRVASYLITGILNAPQQEFSLIVGYTLMAFEVTLANDQSPRRRHDDQLFFAPRRTGGGWT
ncbi:MAG TPA: hypothetical protein VI094_07535 [Propionibacteriaceae bacterium]